MLSIPWAWCSLIWRINSFPWEFKFHPQLRKHNFLLRVQKTCPKKSKPLRPPNDLAPGWAEIEADGLNQKQVAFISCSWEDEVSNTPSQHPRRHFTFLVPRLGFEGSYLSDGTQALPQGLGRLTWASSFQLQSTTSLLLSGLLSADLSTIHSTLPAGRKKKKQSQVPGWASEAHMLIYTGGKTPLLLPSVVTPATSEPLPELQPPSQGSTWPSVHPDLPFLELSNFRVSCRLSKANSSTIT